MERIETNIFPIANLQDLSSRYRLIRVLGLRPAQSEYYQNLQQLLKLSYTFKEPVACIERNGEPYLVVPESVTSVPASYELVRTIVQLQPLEEIIDLDFTKRNIENDEICLRFLRFYIQKPLFNDPRLWQQKAGYPFFERHTVSSSSEICQYLGFTPRPIILRDGGIGFCVDATSCYVRKKPLPTNLDRDTFNRSYKDRNFIYHYGDQWHQIKLTDFADLDVSCHQVVIDGAKHHLLDYIIRQAKKPISEELAHLPNDTAVVLYRNSRGFERAAPTALCYPVIDTEAASTREYHSATLLPPHKRRELILKFVRDYMSRLTFGKSILKLELSPINVECQVFQVPDFLFGNGAILSTQGTTGARNTSMQDLGKTRVNMLRDRSAGFYSASPLDRQYFFMPATIHDSCGTTFLADLRKEVDDLFPQTGGYNPIVIRYEDTGNRTFVKQAIAIRKAAEASCNQSGYGVVMIHAASDRTPRHEDQLVSMVARELYNDFDIRVGVIHSDMVRRCYRETQLQNGNRQYCADESQRGKLSGYLRNVALNHVLLTNHRWPFVLGTRLHADVTIGIDTKNNTCGMLAVNEDGTQIHFLAKTSRQKDKLLDKQMASYLVDAIRDVAQNRKSKIESIVIHRDGRCWQSELRGIDIAIEYLKREGIIASNASAAVLELSKSSPAPFRLFDVRHKDGRNFVENPRIGTCYAGEIEGYLCTTGREFRRRGTVQPLHVRKVQGATLFTDCMEDLYRLSTLAWTRPEDCTRYPITIKLNDRFLFEEAGQYDSQALEYAETLGEEQVA